MSGLQTAQRPAVHTLVLQSPGVRQAFPALHFGHASPPQSTSVSEPSCVPFEHVAAGLQTSEPLEPDTVHVPLAQVAPEEQLFPLRQRVHAPPQSVPVSPPLDTPSSHVGG